jgi:hypothetical protein
LSIDGHALIALARPSTPEANARRADDYERRQAAEIVAMLRNTGGGPVAAFCVSSGRSAQIRLKPRVLTED